jgi:hypothetical protein
VKWFSPAKLVALHRHEVSTRCVTTSQRHILEPGPIIRVLMFVAWYDCQAPATCCSGLACLGRSNHKSILTQDKLQDGSNRHCIGFASRGHRWLCFWQRRVLHSGRLTMPRGQIPAWADATVGSAEPCRVLYGLDQRMAEVGVEEARWLAVRSQHGVETGDTVMPIGESVFNNFVLASHPQSSSQCNQCSDQLEAPLVALLGMGISIHSLSRSGQPHAGSARPWEGKMMGKPQLNTIHTIQNGNRGCGCGSSYMRLSSQTRARLIL